MPKANHTDKWVELAERKHGLTVLRLNPYHCRIPDPRYTFLPEGAAEERVAYIDWWPNTGTWIAQPSGTRGGSFESLIEYLAGEGTLTGQNRILDGIDEAPPW